MLDDAGLLINDEYEVFSAKADLLIKCEEWQQAFEFCTGIVEKQGYNKLQSSFTNLGIFEAYKIGIFGNVS